jgi:hypothetical protein
MAKVATLTQSVWKGPVHIVPLGWGLTATFLVLFILCFLAALFFPNVSLAHSWLDLFSTRPLGSRAQLVEGVIWNVVRLDCRRRLRCRLQLARSERLSAARRLALAPWVLRAWGARPRESEVE